MFPEHPDPCQDYPLSSQNPTPDFVNSGNLDGKTTFRRAKCLAKVVNTMETPQR